MKLKVEDNELPELLAALKARQIVYEGLVNRARKSDRLKLSRERQIVADLIAKVKALEAP